MFVNIDFWYIFKLAYRVHLAGFTQNHLQAIYCNLCYQVTAADHARNYMYIYPFVEQTNRFAHVYAEKFVESKRNNMCV